MRYARLFLVPADLGWHDVGDSMIGKISAALVAGAMCVAGAPAIAADFEMADESGLSGERDMVAESG